MFPWNMLFPFNKQAGEMLKNMQSKDIDPLMGNFFSQFAAQAEKMFAGQDSAPDFNFMASSGQGKQAVSDSPASVFETHENVYVRIAIKESAPLDKLKIFHTSNQLILEGLPESKDRRTVTLPSLVKKKGAQAVYKEGILEVKIPKNEDMQYSEINVSKK
ncbi:Hsp20/alpha crystallin family protein [Peribacillus sp. SCS-37]|uniref:Hsp20/alpha crystallin family protein n=1 Tax=Paraperibacillus esterisolvens TaxID=3115296 RepID=UPI0039061056